jgi:hypothetical protein
MAVSKPKRVEPRRTWDGVDSRPGRADRDCDLRQYGREHPKFSERVTQIAVDTAVIMAVTVGVLLASAHWLLR